MTVDGITAPAIATATADRTPSPPSRLRRAWESRPPFGALFGIVFLVVLTFLAIFAGVLPFVRDATEKVRVGGEVANQYGLGPGATALFGTDSLGGDVFAKCIYGARTTLIVGLGATVMGLVLGGVIGVLAGYLRGYTDRAVGIIVDCLLAMPSIVLAVVMVTKLDTLTETTSGLGWLSRRWQITLTLGILAIAPLARIVRAQTLSLREREFVLAARSIGAPTRRVIGREILPNLIPTMITVSFTGLGILIAAEGALAFLGLSVETPTPTWGKLIDQNRNDMDDAWWATIFPCLMLFLTVLSFNLVGDWLSRRFDIRKAAI
ncbi:ABC transporter permease [Desertimonas flava]|jgi:peptide/nickel transport system permease protein|uniref:ABC transporter permease n=1 Tax=Desertimonas flava TaxID=2064846 RepID=UPI000E349D99|nr:ABC transporter permease [Desertimonas flava]